MKCRHVCGRYMHFRKATTPPPPHTHIEFCSSLSNRKELNPWDISKNSSAIIAQEKRTQLTTHTWALWMCLSLEPYDIERLKQLCHFTSRSELVIIWSPFLKLYHSSSQSLFSSWLIFLRWFTLKRYLCYIFYIVKAKENSREFVWQIIMVDGEWCSERG
jgi:hypothetical protein